MNRGWWNLWCPFFKESALFCHYWTLLYFSRLGPGNEIDWLKLIWYDMKSITFILFVIPREIMLVIIIFGDYFVWNGINCLCFHSVYFAEIGNIYMVFARILFYILPFLQVVWTHIPCIHWVLSSLLPYSQGICIC